MIIGIDGNEANVENRVGINTYAFNVLWELNRMSKANNNNKYIIYLKSTPSSNLPKENRNWEYKVLKAKKLWILTRLAPYLRLNSDKIDVFFTPSHYIPPFVNIPRVFSVMDLGYLESTEQFRTYDYWQLKLWTAYSMNVSKRIITISGQSERDIVRHHPKTALNTYITHLAYDKNIFNTKYNLNSIKDIKNRYSIVGNYILFMSTLKPSKNIDGLINAWNKVESKHKNTQLVIAGKKGWLYEPIFELVKKLKLEGRVVFTDFVPEKDKEHLIKGASVFILPSFWEGFGLDVLSSMASGVPTIISKIGSLPEVGGSAAVYVDPKDVNNIAQKISDVLELSKKEYNKLSDVSRLQASKFSWGKCAKHTLEILESAI